MRKCAIRLVATGIGAMAAGPLGAALGASLGGLFSEQAARLIEPYLHSGAEKLSEFGVHYCFDKFREMQPHPPLEEVATEALHRALEQVQATLDPSLRESYSDWFENWISISNKTAPTFDSLPTLVLPSGVPQQEQALDRLFRETMERLDGTARARKLQDAGQAPSITGNGSFRTMPDELLHLLLNRLPHPLHSNFNRLIALPEHSSAWITVEQHFQKDVHAWFARLDATTTRIEAKLDLLLVRDHELNRAVQAKEIAEEEARLLRTRNESLEEYKEKYEKLEAASARSQDPGEQQFASLLAAGDLEGAAALRTKQVETQQGKAKGEVSKLARYFSELGQVHDLRFAWAKALECYREAWRLDPKMLDYGFRYALFAQKQNRFGDAIAVYCTVLPLCTNPPQVAATLNNLANLYRATQRMKEAEQSYQEALTIRRRLAEANPEAYLPDVAMTLNNLAILYRATQRMKDSEQSYQEALTIRRRLAEANPEAYLPNVAMTLNNLANLYRATQRMKEAEQSYQEALTIRRRLAETNPEAYLPYVAMTLNNLAILYSATQRLKDSEQSYQEALTTYRRLAEANPEAYLPNVATTLNNLANLYSDTQRLKDAEQFCGEARAILEPLWQHNPELHGNQLARINLLDAQLAGPEQAKEACQSARQAFAVAYDAELKEAAQKLIDQFCAPPPQ
jgi:tetratricopeptide (TPR) repeat protein